VSPTVIKVGDTLRFVASVVDDDDRPLAVDGLSISSWVRAANGRFVQEMTIAAGDAPSEFRLIAPDTSLWPVGSLECDIKISVSAFEEHSDTFLIRVDRPVTP